MLAGELYRPGSPELNADQKANKTWIANYNAVPDRPADERLALLKAHFGAVGDDGVIRPPFFCDFGYNIRLGDNVFLNFNCMILDIVAVSIGDRTQVVTRDVAPGAIVAGNPAKPIAKGPDGCNRTLCASPCGCY